MFLWSKSSLKIQNKTNGIVILKAIAPKSKEKKLFLITYPKCCFTDQSMRQINTSQKVTTKKKFLKSIAKKKTNSSARQKKNEWKDWRNQLTSNSFLTTTGRRWRSRWLRWIWSKTKMHLSRGELWWRRDFKEDRDSRSNSWVKVLSLRNMVTTVREHSTQVKKIQNRNKEEERPTNKRKKLVNKMQSTRKLEMPKTKPKKMQENKRENLPKRN